MKNQVRLRIVENKRLGKVRALYFAVEPAEQDACVVHIGAHRLAVDRKRLEGDVESRIPRAEIKRSVKSAVRSLDVDLRELFEASVNKKAVFVTVAVIPHPACQTKRKAFAVDDRVRAQPLVVVEPGL